MIKNILITGGAGYIGSHISEILIKDKKKVFIVDNLSTGYKKLVSKKVKFYKADIKDKKKINYIIKKNNIDTVVHLAASLVISEGEKNPNLYYKNNVIGTKKLLEACQKTNIKNFIFSSTAAVYRDGFKTVSEYSNIKPKSVYGKTKLRAEKLIIKYCSKKKINYGILRYFNIVGASPSGKIGLINKGDHLFKNFSEQILRKNPILKIYGNKYKTKDGTCIRDFIHVSDIAEIHIKVLEKINNSNKSKILNCGYGIGFSVKQIANEFLKYTEKNIKVIYSSNRKGDLIKIVSSNRNLKKFINWKPKFNNLKTMVQSSIKWEKKINKSYK